MDDNICLFVKECGIRVMKLGYDANFRLNI